MANLHEVSGLELIERISKESFKKERHRTRVWSDAMNCWGFFGKDPNELDKTIVIGCSKAGDFILPDGSMIWKYCAHDKREPYKHVHPTNTLGVILSKQVDIYGGNSVVKVSFFLGGENSGIFDIFVQQSIAYKALWELVT